MKTRLIVSVLGAALVAVTPVPALLGAPPQHREQKREYHFRQEDAGRLREHYKGRSHVDWNHREHFVAGGHLPGDWRRRIEPVPRVVLRELPPIPAGLSIGYINGYCVVYDPVTLEIVDVLDLQ